MNTQAISVATEGIANQGDGFFQRLLADLATLPRSERSSAKTADWETLEKKISKTINDVTGLTVHVDIANRHGFSIIHSIIDFNHILLADEFDRVSNPDDQFKFLTNRVKDLKVELDLKKSKVSGGLSKLPYALEINRNSLFSTYLQNIVLTDEEIVALMLHEIGHAFTGLEFLDRTVLTNQVLAELNRKLLSAGAEPSKRTTIIKTAGRELGLDRMVISDVIDKEDKVVTAVMVTHAMKQMRTQSGHTFYDMNTWEMLADQFCARHGAGAHLATALQKMETIYPDLTALSTGNAIYRQAILSIAGGLFLTLGALAISVGTVGAVLGGFVLGYVGFAAVKYDHMLGEPLYDNAISRLTRIRNELVSQIKDYLGEPKNEATALSVKTLLTDVKIIDKLTENWKDRTSFVLQVIAFFSANESNRQANTKMQKELEALAHNELFTKALVLKTI